MTERKLVTIEKVLGISPIAKSDNLEKATIRGWSVVVKRGAFQVGDYCVFFEIDSFLPLEQKYEFLRKSSFRKNGNGEEGFRLKTVKLRGQISQGLAMSLADCDIYQESENVWKYSNPIGNTYFIDPNSNEDLSNIFNVVKYEPAIPKSLSGMAKGTFPSYIPKTDQERIQNLFSDPDQLKEILGNTFEITLKLDGTSATYYKNVGGEIGACSRNLDLKLEDNSSMYVKFSRETGILDIIPEGYAIQGELYGNGIQGNHDKLPTVSLYVFDIFDIVNQKYLTPLERKTFFEQYLTGKHEKIKHVPIFPQAYFGDDMTLEQLLEVSNKMPSINNPICEGLVYKRIDGKYSFKVISDKFLCLEE